MSQKKVILIIMDGWGLGKVASSDAIQHANVPFTKSLYSKYPNTTLDHLWRSRWTARRTDGQFRSGSPESGCRPDRLPGITTDKCGDQGWLLC